MHKTAATRRAMAAIRCAIYTRKSSEEGLEQDVQLAGCPAGGL